MPNLFEITHYNLYDISIHYNNSYLNEERLMIKDEGTSTKEKINGFDLQELLIRKLNEQDCMGFKVEGNKFIIDYFEPLTGEGGETSIIITRHEEPQLPDNLTTREIIEINKLVDILRNGV